MKSIKAKEHIKNFEYKDKDGDHVVLSRWAFGAVEVAEAELEETNKEAIYLEGFWNYKSGWNDMKERAIEAFCDVCGIRNHLARNIENCAVMCQRYKDFLAALDNDKPIQTE